ncbi:MAG: hypothetical protein JJU42_12130 [Rhodobacteraceae bacterium]|nr:hypothetical protein [Paracoccaceae bacterium]
MPTLNERDLVDFTKKLLKDIFRVEARREQITPRITIWALDLSREMILASAGIRFLGTLWKGTHPASANIRGFNDLIGLLRDSTKEGVKSYLNGEVQLGVTNIVRARWRSTVDSYFNYGTISDADFEIRYRFSDRVRGH